MRHHLASALHWPLHLTSQPLLRVPSQSPLPDKQLSTHVPELQNPVTVLGSVFVQGLLRQLLPQLPQLVELVFKLTYTQHKCGV